jgi:broad-specificity NMP kinase
MCDNKWLTEIEVAEMLSCSRSKLRNDRCRRRGLPYYKINNSIRYEMTDIIAYMEERRVDPRE